MHGLHSLSLINNIYFSLQRHITIQKASELPQLQQCKTCCNNFHCPFCESSVFKPTRQDKVKAHLQSHIKKAVTHEGMNILSYLLTYICKKIVCKVLPWYNVISFSLKIITQTKCTSTKHTYKYTAELYLNWFGVKLCRISVLSMCVYIYVYFRIHHSQMWIGLQTKATLPLSVLYKYSFKERWFFESFIYL